MRILVASKKHGLLPFVWRLHREKHDVEVLVWRDRFEHAWAGMFPKALVGKEKNRESQTTLGDLARAGEFTVMVDDEKGEEVFAGARNLFGYISHNPGADVPSSIAVGGWFDGERTVPHLTHVLVKDYGVLTGGLGPGLIGGATLIKADTLPDRARSTLDGLLATHTDLLKSKGFRGLYGVDVHAEPNGQLRPGALLGGWQPIHSHAFISEISNLGQLMEGGGSGSMPTLGANYVVVVPVTVPPFPNISQGHSMEVEVKGLNPADTKSIFFHDFYTKGSGEIWVAGLDGFVAVIRGSGYYLHTAQREAYRVAGKMLLPEKQYRLDVGHHVPEVLAALEGLE